VEENSNFEFPPSFVLGSKLGPSNKLKNSENGTYFISCGIAVALMNGITKPTQVNLHYEYEGNNFLLYRLEPITKPPPINFSSDSESIDGSTELKFEEIVSFTQGHQVVHEEVEEEVVHGDLGDYRWTKVISKTFAQGKSVLVSYSFNF
jgi:hypothetical protein